MKTKTGILILAFLMAICLSAPAFGGGWKNLHHEDDHSSGEERLRRQGARQAL